MNENQTRAIATVGALATTGVGALALHGGPIGFLATCFVALVTWHGGDIIVEATKSLIMTEHVESVERLVSVPQPELLHEDQRVSAKLKRLVSSHKLSPMPEQTCTIPAGRLVTLGKNLQLDIDDIVGKAIFIAGIRRSGKTTLGALLAEEMGRFNIPMLIPCLKGDWLSLAGVLPNGKIADSSTVSIENAQSVGYAIYENGYQLILDIASFDSVDTACSILAKMIEGLFEWAKKHPDDKRPCEVFLDEAQTFLPENQGDSIISDSGVLRDLSRAYMRVIAVGGSYGLSPVIMTQRIAQVSKKIIGQPELMFLLKQTMDNDIKRYRDFTTIVSEKDIRSFPVGAGVFVGYDGSEKIVQFNKRRSDDSMSKSPRADAARKYLDIEEELASMPDLYSDDDDNERYPDTQELEEIEVENNVPLHIPAPIMPEKGRRAEDIELSAAIALWNAGYNSRRKLAGILGITENQAQKLMDTIKSQAVG